MMKENGGRDKEDDDQADGKLMNITQMDWDGMGLDWIGLDWIIWLIIVLFHSINITVP